MTEITKFNFLLQEFLDKMVNKFQNDKLNSYRRAFMLLKFTSPESPVNLFMTSCLTYKHQIISRDEKFFLTNKEIENKVNNFGNFTEECGLSYYWESLSSISKSSIWDYIQSLFVLGEIIVNKNKELFNKYNNLRMEDNIKDVKSALTNDFTPSFLKKI